MVWQDFVISGANAILFLSLVPQIYYGFKAKKGVIKRWTSIPTFICLYGMSFAFFTLDLMYSSSMTALAATGWLVLFIQSVMYK